VGGATHADYSGSIFNNGASKMHIVVDNSKDALPTHRVADPAILYFGTPVVLIGTINEDGSYNLSPMSSAWWLGHRCMLGLGMNSKTTENMLRTGECVLNLPSAELVAAVDRLARTTGSNPVPPLKAWRGYRFEKDKFEVAGLTPLAGETVAAPRVAECPVHLEAKVAGLHNVAQDDAVMRGHLAAVEVSITRIHLDERIMMEGEANRVDPDKWRPLIMSFQQFYGLAPGKLQRSELAEISEEMYRPPAKRA
jgi:flavin reductase (DIM6/NTAB) family NADH-FMN oxidoreductase RutF